MSDLSQHPLLHHVQCSQGKRIVTTVLQHHAVTAGFFGCIHQTPAIGHTHGGRNLQSDMTSLLQSINRNLGMSQPVCTNINKIYLFTFAHPAPHPLFRIVLSLRDGRTPKICSARSMFSFRKSQSAFTSMPSRCIYLSSARMPLFPNPTKQGSHTKIRSRTGFHTFGARQVKQCRSKGIDTQPLQAEAHRDRTA